MPYKDKERAARQRKVRYESDKDEVLRKQKIYYEVNKERISARDKAKYESDKEKVLRRQKIYRDSNKERLKTYRVKRYYKIFERNDRRKRGLKGRLSPDIRMKLWRQQSGFCAYYKFCKSVLNETGYHLDHIWPVSSGGINTDSNVQLLCPSCNLTKKAKHPRDFEREIGLLK